MEPGELKKSVQKELLKILYRDLRYAIISVGIASLILIYGLWPVLDKEIAVGWLLLLSLVLIAGWKLLERYARDKERYPNSYWLKYLHRFMLLFTVVWIAGILLLYPPGEPLYQSFLIIILAGITAGGVSSLSTDRFSALTLIGGILLTLVGRLFWEGEPLYRLEALLTMIYMILLIYSVNRFHRHRVALLTEWYHARESSSTLAQSRARLGFLFNAVPVGIFYYDRALHVVEGNAHFLKLLGGENELEGSPGKEKYPSLPENFLPVLREALNSEGREIQKELKVMQGGKKRWIRLKACTVDGEGKRSGAAIFIDITEQMKKLEKIRYDADHDPLTRLPNRTFFMRELSRSLKKMKEEKGSVGILFIDLDNFKPINDRYGHSLGDRVLTAVGRRIRHYLRRKDLVARYGGDEFVILLQGLSPLEKSAATHLRSIANKLLKAFQHPLIIDDTEHTIGLSIGIALSNASFSSAQELVNRADQAMYHAKTTGKNRIAYASDLSGKQPLSLQPPLHEERERAIRKSDRLPSTPFDQ